MHTTEPKNAFLVMRANGWSLGSISRQLGVPKSTLFNWESDPAIHRSINVIKSLQLEKLQEKLSARNHDKSSTDDAAWRF